MDGELWDAYLYKHESPHSHPAAVCVVGDCKGNVNAEKVASLNSSRNTLLNLFSLDLCCGQARHISVALILCVRGMDGGLFVDFPCDQVNFKTGAKVLLLLLE